jgi:ATP-dependent helicase HrpB
MLEPRRLAARTIAYYLAQQLGEAVGQRVGYQMRGERRVSDQTQLLVVTEGVLTRMIQTDPELNGVALVIFDEFHERSLHADLGLALCLEVCQLNERLRLLVMSATLDASAIAALLPEAAVLVSEGRSYPVTHHYQSAPQPRDLLACVSRTVLQALESETGHILVFLPGASEIRRCAAQLQSQLESTVVIHCLYGQLSLEDQRAAIAPPPSGQRKVVLATNIAETSLTIDGIRVVVDSGLERYALFHPGSGVTRLVTRMICQASAEQRAGRGGRQQAGICYRLYSQEQLSARPKFNLPQISRSDLSSLALQLCQWGVSSSDLRWLDEPPAGALAQAMALLGRLALVDDAGRLTAKGEQVCTLGSDPRLAAMLLQAKAWSERESEPLLARACWLAAAIESNRLRSESAMLSDALSTLPRGDGASIRAQAQRYFKGLATNDAFNTDGAKDWDALLLSCAYPDRIAQRRGSDDFRLSNGFGVCFAAHQHPAGDFLVVVDLGWQEGRANGQAYLATELCLDSLKALRPEWFAWHEHCEWDAHAERVVSQQVQALSQLVLARRPSQKVSPAQIGRTIVDEVRRQGFDWLPLSSPAQAWHQRYLCAVAWVTELDWPNLTADGLMARLDDWLLPYLDGINSYKGLRSLDWLGLLRNQLEWRQQEQLERLVPNALKVPSGREVALYYQVGLPPKVSLKLQEVFGQPQSPTVAEGRVAVTLELLSPGGRALQVTQDLASFWKSAYPDVQKEMKGRYPKHPWPDDPISAVASAKTNRQLRRDT